MLNLTVDSKKRGPLRILCLGAHCDDIDLGCGGTLLALLQRYRSVHVTWVTFSAQGEREREFKASARQFLRRAARTDIVSHAFRDGYFPHHFAQIKEAFEALKRLPDPDLVFTHHRIEHHQDHRIVAELTWNTFRNHMILEYEIPKYEGGLTTPTVYVGLAPELVRRKVDILMKCYETQRAKRWFTPDTFRGLMRLRGIESGSRSGWAEGFHVSKILLG